MEIKKHTILEIISSPAHNNLFTASFTENIDGTFTPNDIHRMIPFENYDYKNLAQKYNLNLENEICRFYKWLKRPKNVSDTF